MYEPVYLPLVEDIETKRVLKKSGKARSALAELKGVAASMPNESILINTLALQEAKDSSEVENIVTTHDELYKFSLFTESQKSPASKEVENYISALKHGFNLVYENGLLTENYILQIHEKLEANEAGYRKLPGTNLKNNTGEVVYTPPQDSTEVIKLMGNLEKFINDPDFADEDDLVKVAIMHFQFESIHPFYDGNGRTGRILNILYLVKQGLLKSPILYLSRYVTQNKSDYYRLLQDVRDNDNWEEWILYILDAIEKTALQTIELIHKVKKLMDEIKHKLRSELPKIYSQDLLNNIFRHPYTKIDFIMHDIGVSRLTASKYLDQLVEVGILQKDKIGRQNYYINKALVEVLMNLPTLEREVTV